MQSQKTIKVAAVNSWCEPLAIGQNIDNTSHFLAQLQAEKVDYALFPELGISGYINNKNDLQKFATQYESVIDQLTELSAQFQPCFSVGCPMPLAGGFGIAQLSFQGGTLLHCHFKTHLSVHEKEVFLAGSELQNLSLQNFKLGMHLCLESHYPELSLAYQQQGAELLGFAFASPREKPAEKLKRFKIMLQARAYDNACFVMACNQTGKTPSGKNYAGAALILSPRGKVLSECANSYADYCTATLDYSEIERIKNSNMSNFPAYRKTELQLKFK